MTWLEGIRDPARCALLGALALTVVACQTDADAEPVPPSAPALEAIADVARRNEAVARPEVEVEARTEAVVEAPVEVPAPPVAASPHTYLRTTINSSLEASLVAETEPRLGAELTQVTKRVLVWWLDIRRHLRKGDVLEIVYETRPDAEPIVHAIWFTSQKLGRTMTAVLFQPEGERFARWYDETGHEIEMRLKHGPLKSYEQITSLLKDGRRHRGVDFKAPVGEPILAPFSGRVVRRNWSFRRNGNCLEIVDDRTNTHAFFLHLERVGKNMRPGTRVKRGQRVATSGNTGRSTAPHLHYQLEKNGRVIDPFRFHDTYRDRLSSKDADAARRALARFDELRTRST